MNPAATLLPAAITAALAGHAVLVVLWLAAVPPAVVLLAWLAAALTVLGIASGAQAILCLHGLTGGRWIDALEPLLGRLSRLAPLATLPLFALLPAVTLLFPWAGGAGELPHETAHLIRKKAWWLDVPFFIGRTFVFAAITLLLAVWCDARMSAARAAAGMVLWMLAVSLLAIDWLMSLAPEWFSTMIGLWLGSSFVLSALALTALATATQRGHDAARRNDVAVLLLAAVLFWSYLGFMQYLVVWSGNLPEEISWFVARRTPYWSAIAVLMVLLAFAVPLVTLVFSPARRSRGLLGAVAATVLVGRMLESEWQIQPAAQAPGALHAAASAAALLGLGGLAVAAVVTMAAFDGGDGRGDGQ